MKLPTAEHYKDLHAGMIGKIPRMTDEALNAFMRLHDAKWKDKVQVLYKERYIDNLVIQPAFCLLMSNINTVAIFILV